MKLYFSGPGGGMSGSAGFRLTAAPRSRSLGKLRLEGRHRRQLDDRRHAVGVLLELVDEDRHEAGVELPAAQALQLVDRLLVSPRRLIGPAVEHRLVGVGDGDDTSTKRYRLTTQAVRVAATVVALVVVTDDRD